MQTQTPSHPPLSLLGYVRLTPGTSPLDRSDVSQVTMYGASLKRQCKDLGHSLIDVSSDISDPVFDTKRIPEGLTEAIERVKQDNNLHGLAVFSPQSLSRHLTVFLHILTRLPEKKLVTFDPCLTLEGGQDATLSPELFTYFSQVERNLTIERETVHAGRKDPSRSIGPVPYGWRRCESRNEWGYKTLTPHKEEQAVLRAICDYRRAGWTMLQISQFLNRCKVPTASGVGPWTREKVNYIFHRSKNHVASPPTP